MEKVDRNLSQKADWIFKKAVLNMAERRFKVEKGF
jgi:hypothetical protein